MKILLLVTLLCSVNMIAAAKVDTLTAFNTKSPLHHYRINGMTMQAARFEPMAGGAITSITILLGGHTDSGSARVRVFGNEAGASAPFLEQDLVPPIVIHKTQRWVQEVVIQLDTPLHVNTHQFFIAVDQISDGVLLVSDIVKKQAACSEFGEDYRFQCMKMPGGRWVTGPYGYAIRAIVEYDAKGEKRLFKDVTEEAGLNSETEFVGSIAWADYNDDSYLDLLAGGRLFENLRNGSFADVTSAVGLSGNPDAGLFIDMNNDGRADVLFLGDRGTSSVASSLLFTNKGEGVFDRKEIPLISVKKPTSFSVADANNDGYPDLFVGQSHDTDGASLPNHLLINDRNNGFTDRSTALYPDSREHPGSQGSEWVDVNDDGFPDLFVANQGANGCELWRNNGDGTFSMMCGSTKAAPASIHSVNSIGGHWRRTVGADRPSLIVSQHVRLSDIDGDSKEGTEALLTPASSGDFMLQTVDPAALGIEFNEMRGGASWGDLDNDGRLDLIFSSGSRCRYADVYVQQPSGRYERQTSSYGLLHVAAGPGSVLADYNNDGLLDLATTINGDLRLYKNTATADNNYVAVDMVGRNVLGAKIQLFAGDKCYTSEISSGRGLLMQDPMRIHFGLGDDAHADSLVVRWPDGNRQVYTNVEINKIARIKSNNEHSTDASAALANFGAFPNPFSDKVEFFYELVSQQLVTIQVFDAQGRLVRELIHQTQAPGVHSVAWDALDASGQRVAQGAYGYRIMAGAEQRTGSVMVVK